jgi:carbonic anhydrase
LLAWIAAALLMPLGTAAAQAPHAAPAGDSKGAAPPTTAEQKRGTPPLPTHAPQPEVPPLALLAHVREGHERWLEARRGGKPAPAPAERPAGAGRYVCAVVVCADCDLDVPALLGLRRADVLLFSVPGPFVTPEVSAAIERQVLHERLGLVLLFTHTHCATLAPADDATPPDVLAAKAALAAKEALRRRQPLGKTLVQAQRELLLASAEGLSRQAAVDKVRIVPAEIDSATGAITWHQRPIDALPMPPVK